MSLSPLRLGESWVVWAVRIALKPLHLAREEVSV
jgi:hypothetical protein